MLTQPVDHADDHHSFLAKVYGQPLPYIVYATRSRELSALGTTRSIPELVSTSTQEQVPNAMADSLLLDEVVGFLHTLDAPINGNELVTALDKPDSVSLWPGAEIDLQLVDISTDDFFLDSNQLNQEPQVLSDSDCTSVECESIASPVKPVVIENVRSKDAIRRREYREKQKAQKEELYRQVEELSMKLVSLQQNQEAAKARRGLGVASPAVWKALANRHLHARLIAEEQQRKLHEAVQRRAQLIESLGNMVQKRIAEEQPDHELMRPMKRARPESPDAVLFEAYIKELDEVYARVDDVFSETVVRAADVPHCYFTPMQPRRKDASYHELVGKRSTPFPFDQVRKRMRDLQCMWHRVLDRVDYSGPCLSSSTTAMKVRIPGDTPSRSLVQYAIMRKYYESDRVVIICRKFTEGEGAYTGMHSDETGWTIVRPSPGSADVAGSTSMETVIRYVPMTFSAATGSDTLLKEFSDLIIKAGEEDCRKSLSIMEDTLLNEAFALGVC